LTKWSNDKYNYPAAAAAAAAAAVVVVGTVGAGEWAM